MAQTFFNHFRCRVLSEELWVLDADYSIECFPDDKTELWWVFALVASLGLIFVIGFPIGALSSDRPCRPRTRHKAAQALTVERAPLLQQECGGG